MCSLFCVLHLQTEWIAWVEKQRAKEEQGMEVDEENVASLWRVSKRPRLDGLGVLVWMGRSLTIPQTFLVDQAKLE